MALYSYGLYEARVVYLCGQDADALAQQLALERLADCVNDVDEGDVSPLSAIPF